jgi:hypothetical protein
MRQIVITMCLGLAAVAPAAAVEFLGVELCEGSVDTSVVLPVGSPLTLDRAEIGRHGGLLMLLQTDKGRVMDRIDELMEYYTGSPGTGSEEKLQWSGNQITAYAQLIKEGYAALAVSTSDDCKAADSATADDAAGTAQTEEIVEAEVVESETAPVVAPAAAGGAAVVATTAATPAESPTTAAPAEDFKLDGKLKHTRADATWVDVMGVVVNKSGVDYKIANFDLSFYDADGDLICVDAISVSELRDGQERAFRDSIRCADYDPDAVADWKLQFAGGQ